MAATLTDFRAQFPEFATTADAVVERFLSVAAEMHGIRNTATLYCTAHLLRLEADRAAGTASGGEVTDERAGPLWQSYKSQADAGWETFFTRTEYGRMFLTLERRTPRFAIGATVAG